MTKRRLTAGAAFALVVALPAPAGASSSANLRVVDSSGRTLAEQTQYTGTVLIQTDPNATCFGPGTGGSGNAVKVPGASALGAVADAAAFDRAVNPLSVTDSFDFGLGVCGFGKAVAPSSGFWYLKVNHVAAALGGDHITSRCSDADAAAGTCAKLASGDQILWYLDSDFSDAAPGELFLDAPSRAKPGTKFKAKVVSYADDGTRTPVQGATVTGAEEQTDATGKTTVSFPNSGPRVMQATLPGSIPSNQVNLCLEIDLSQCSAQPPQTIFGSAHTDNIVGTKGDDKISAGDGNDNIDISSGGDDSVQCGSGNDKVTGASDGDHVGKSCEQGRL